MAAEWLTDVPAADTIIKLHGVVEKCQQQTGNTKACVTCMYVNGLRAIVDRYRKILYLITIA